MASLSNASILVKKRQLVEERTARLLDPKVRSVGIDKEALDEQLKEKAALSKLEQEREKFFDTQMIMMDKHAQVLQREVDTLRLQREREVAEYRQTFQKAGMSREADLNARNRVREAVPARVGDDDPRCGPASLQKFEGEDLDSQVRRRVQASQQRDWAQQQIEEKLMKKWIDKEYHAVADDRMEEVANRTWQIQQQVAGQRRQAAVSTSEFNKAMAEQKRKERQASKMEETQRNLEEIQNMLDSQWLGEAVTTKATNPNKPCKDAFKGLSFDQRVDIANTQKQQIQELKDRRLAEIEEDRQYAIQEQMENRMAIAINRQRDRERRDKALKLGEERERQREEAIGKRKVTNELYRNQIGEEFFRFGKSL